MWNTCFYISDQTKLIHCDFDALDTLFMSPKGVSSNSRTILRICKKIEELRTYFDMKLSQNNVKYMFLNSGLNKLIPL